MPNFKGRIHWFDKQKGFGYVKDGYGNSYFYHQSNITKGRLIQIVGFESNDEVEFDIEESERGQQAVNVTLIREASPNEPEPVFIKPFKKHPRTTKPEESDRRLDSDVSGSRKEESDSRKTDDEQ